MQIALIEQFSHEFELFFEEPDHQVRWDRLRDIYSSDYGSFRVLFLVETIAFLQHWREPTTTELTTLMTHLHEGGQVGIEVGTVIDLFTPVWPLEVAKYEYLVHRATWNDSFRRKYLFTTIRSFTSVASQEVVSQAGRRSPQGDLLRTTLPMQVDVRDHRIILHEGLTNVEEDDGGHRERGRVGAAPQAGIGS